jgi:hypothetical protein
MSLLCNRHWHAPDVASLIGAPASAQKLIEVLKTTSGRVFSSSVAQLSSPARRHIRDLRPISALRSMLCPDLEQRQQAIFGSRWPPE